ncbi:MAG TPA: glycoside hydrolase family 3 C-terminal domain-containing protein [Bryobacteraceae bacterium]|nr:glycoside hydrolase family 3 C-terminal domain-containing protein [Bryobacteraceae bacterium]
MKRICCSPQLACLLAIPALLLAQPAKPPKVQGPWMDKSLPPDKRADLVIGQMTLAEKIQLVHGTGWGALRPGAPVPPGSNEGAGFVPGIERLGIPPVNMADSAVGVRMAAVESRYATLLPSTLGAAASFDPDAAYLYGSVIGRELRDQGFNMSIGGGVDLIREPRNGRNFEYAGEDPILAGIMVGQLMKGLQAQQVMGDIKHYAFNDQETGRNILNVILDKRSMRETDLLAFQIAVKIAQPAGVMCAYNKVNGDYSCENDYLLNQVLKKEWGFQGWVLSDWGGTHSTTKAALAGLDQEMPGDRFFGAPLEKAVDSREVPEARLNDMVHRILRSMFACGVIDDPPVHSVVDPFQGLEDAQHIAEESIVLLKNEGGLLPLNATPAQSIALIGSHADVGVLSGGGSAQVDPPGGDAVTRHKGGAGWMQPVWFPSSPLKYIRAQAPQATVQFNDGTDTAAAAKLARDSQVAIVFVNQFMSEGRDAASLTLPDNQDALVSAVAAANPRTIVVIESGGPVAMPWIENVKGVIEAWYPGIGGAQALAAILFGGVNPSAKLPVTFARSDADLPHPQVPGIDLKPANRPPPFDVNYTEGLQVGYKWFEAEHKQPLFPFGYGLSYTTFTYSDLAADGNNRTVRFNVKNTGKRAGTEVAQVYVMLPSAAGEPFKRLAAWERVPLKPGESKMVTLPLDPLYLSIFNAEKDGWELVAGDYKAFAGPLTSAFQVTR